MIRTNNAAVLKALILFCGVLLLASCATHKGQSAFNAAEQLAAEEKFDLAVERYAEAAQLDPGSKTYKMKLIAARTRAAAHHIRQARTFGQEGRIEEALQQYQLARSLDPSLEIAAMEEKQLKTVLEADQLADQGGAAFHDGKLSVARKAVKEALKLAPRHVEALELERMLDESSSGVTLDGMQLDVISSDPMTLRFKKAKTSEVFNVLTKLTGINFILDEDVRDQNISIFLEKASFAQAMQLVLQMNGLEKKILNSKTIIVYPSSRDKDKQYGDQIIQTFYLSHIDAKKAVNLLRTMLQLRKVYVHEERNALVLRDKPEVIQLAEQILAAADREDSEVIFALELVSVSDTDSLNFGPLLSSYSTGFGLSKDGSNIVAGSLGSGGSTDGLIKSLNNLQTFYTLPTAAFNLAKTLSGTQILASPKIRVRNKEKGKVHVGTREPIITTTTTDGGTVSENITYVDVGIKVDIEPTIKLDNTVETKLTLEVSQAEQLAATTQGTIPLRIRTTNAQTVLTLQDGVQTVIGGLFTNNESKNRKTLPLLGDVPLVGSLLSNIDDEQNKQEILFSITPFIVKQVSVPEEDVATLWSGGEDNLKVGPNFGAFAETFKSEIEKTQPAVVPALSQAKPPVQVMSSPEAQPDVLPESDETIPVDAPDATENSPVNDETVPAAQPEQPPKPVSPVVPPASLRLDGPQEVVAGKKFSLTVQVDGATALYSAPLFVNYDPTRLSLLEVEEGGFLSEVARPAVFSSRTNQKTGQIVVGYKQGAGAQGASGSGALFIMRFKAMQAGEALLDLNRVNFRDPQGRRLNVEATSTKVKIN